MIQRTNHPTKVATIENLRRWQTKSEAIERSGKEMLENRGRDDQALRMHMNYLPSHWFEIAIGDKNES
jgi:hypothetical protein